MDYKKFEDNVRMDLPKSLLGTFPHISVEPAEVTKLQGMSYSGISVRQDGSQMSMTVNLDSFYRDYESGAVYEDVLQGITDYVVTHISQTPEFDLDMLKNYESMRPYLTVQMVEKNRNAEKLAEIPHEIVEDMAVVYRFQLGDLPDGKASVLITNPMLEHYGITQEQLHQDALEMAQRSEPLSIKNMDEIMYEMTNGFMGSLDEACSPMYVATNASRMNGAAVMNYPDFMEQAAEKLQGSFYILPSSNVNALYEKFKKDNPDVSSNPFSRWQQKQAIKKEYAAAKAGKNTANGTATVAKGTGKAAKTTKSITEKVTEFCTSHSKVMLLILIAGLLFLVISGVFSSCSAMFQGGTQIILGTSFTAEDEDIIGAENDYKALEAALRNQISNIERTHSGYDEYRYDLSEINHNPYELAAYLTVQFEDYTREEVQSTLQWLFEQQYELTLTEEVEIRTRTETRTGTRSWTDADGTSHSESYEYEVEVEYEYYILNVKLENKGLNRVIGSLGMTEDEMERYAVLLQTSGNRPDLFGDDIYAVTGEYTDYDIPGEALTDTRFANMIREAEKYLGYPYVWGGSSPSTSFDCSGFVSWVINNCGNGWSVGRLTADGLMGVCDIIPKSQAKPGDLIFFQGTYATSGASHVGIYVGNNMMIHCGSPISYASIETSYWQQHFYCFGRIRN